MAPVLPTKKPPGVTGRFFIWILPEESAAEDGGLSERMPERKNAGMQVADPPALRGGKPVHCGLVFRGDLLPRVAFIKRIGLADKLCASFRVFVQMDDRCRQRVDILRREKFHHVIREICFDDSGPRGNG